MFQSQLMFLPNIGDEIFDVVEPLLEPTASYCGSMSPLCCQEHVKYYVPSCSHFEDCWKRKNQHSQSVCVVIGTSSSSGTLVSRSMVRKTTPPPIIVRSFVWDGSGIMVQIRQSSFERKMSRRPDPGICIGVYHPFNYPDPAPFPYFAKSLFFGLVAYSSQSSCFEYVRT